MSYYLRECCSKTPKQRFNEMARETIRIWKYEQEWLNFIPKNGQKSLSLEELKEIRDGLPESRQFCFAMMADTSVSCSNSYGGSTLLKHGYIPSCLKDQQPV